MRISNINQYLGGADAVVAREILEGNQFTKRISIPNFDFTSATFDIDVELFNSEITSRGNSITINNLTKEPNATARNLPSAITNNANGHFDLTIPSDLLSGFDNGANTFTADPNVNTPHVVAMKVQWTLGSDVRSFRMLWIVRYQPNAS